MAQGIEFNFIANARDVVKEAKGATDALEDVADALDEIGDAEPEVDFREVVRRANDAGEEVEDAFDDAAKQSARELDGIEDALRDVERTARQSGRDAGKGLDDGIGSGVSRAKQDLGELKDEAVQNASETFSSFDGSITSLADGIQGTLGGVVSNLGPIGAAAGAAGAIGVGLLIAEFERAQEEAQRLRERVAELATEMIERGSDDLGIQRQIDGLRRLVEETEEARNNITDVIDATDFSDFDALDIGPLASAMAGDLDLVESQLGSVEEALEGLQSVGYENYTAELDEQRVRLEGVRDDLIAVREETVAAEEAYDAWVASGGPALQERQEALSEYASSVQGSLADAGAAWEDYYDAETGALDLGGYLSNIQQRTQAIENYQANLSTASQTLNTEALNYITSLGVESAPLLQAYIDAPLDQQQQLEEVWATLGDAATNTFNTQLQNGIPESVEGPSLTVSTSAAEQAVRDAVARMRAQTITLQARAIVNNVVGQANNP